MKKTQSASRQPKQAAAEQQSVQDTVKVVSLSDFFGRFPDLAACLNKGATDNDATTDDCTELADVVGALSFCVKTFERVGVLVELVRDLAVDGQDLKRMLSLCEEIHNMLNDGQQAVDGAVLE